jgi:hypothetical protein
MTEIWAFMQPSFIILSPFPCQKIHQKAHTQGHIQLTFFLIKMLVTKFGNHEGKVVVLTKSWDKFGGTWTGKTVVMRPFWDDIYILPLLSIQVLTCYFQYMWYCCGSCRYMFCYNITKREENISSNVMWSSFVSN